MKEYYKKSLPTAALFLLTNDIWFFKLLIEMLENVCRRLIYDWDPLEPIKAIQLERESFFHVEKELLMWHKGLDTQAIYMVPVLVTSRQAVGRYIQYYN